MMLRRALRQLLLLGSTVIAAVGSSALGAADSGVVAQTTAPILNPVSAPASRNWPATGRVVYEVLRGENGLKLGEARHSWSQDGKRYSMETVVETTGLAAALYSFHYVQRSEGKVAAGDLQPERFSVKQRGKADELAVFEWKGQKVVLHRKGKTKSASIRAGDQDVLSLWHQAAQYGSEGAPVEMTVVSNKVAAPSSLTVVGLETIRLPMGVVETLRLKAEAKDGSLKLDIWLAEKWQRLPVRIVMTDAKGEVLDQQAIRIELNEPSGTASASGK